MCETSLKTYTVSGGAGEGYDYHKEFTFFNFDEKDFPVFEYDFFEKHIQNYKRILIEKTDDGIVNIHKIFFGYCYSFI